MKNDMILDFVRITRNCINEGNTPKSEEDRIKKIYDDCIFSVIKKYDKDILPKLIICNTYNKYSSVFPVKIKGNKYKYYVLFDRYLKEINNIFNALYLDNNDSGHDIWKLSYELFAEDALIESDTVLLSYYGLNKVALGPFNVDTTALKNLEFINVIQEYYIISHEIGHWIYNVLNNNESSDLFNINFETNWRLLLNDIKDILFEVYDEYEKKFNDKDYIELILEQKDIIKNNSEFLEECFADAIAYAIVFNYTETEYHSNFSKKLLTAEALFLQIMNLQLLAMRNMNYSEESFESSVAIRLGFFRNYVSLYFEQDKKSFEEMIQSTVVRYEDRITEIMLECFSELESRASNISDSLISSEGVFDESKILGVS